MSTKIAQYDAPHQFEPLVPGERQARPLLEQANDLTRAAIALPAVQAMAELRTLLRAMNSYYTNRIEGEHTRPIEIEDALHRDFSKKPDLARRQRLALAHIEAEAICEDELDRRKADGQDCVRWLYTAEALQWMHRLLFERLEKEDRVLADGGELVPGQFRTKGVAVGRHHAPAPNAVEAFIARWSEFYGGIRRGEASLVAAAASHHRLAWVHPFADGNGRVARLHTHLLFYAMDLSKGLWSPLRAFARAEARYKQLLHEADNHRHGDLDGRGNLTEKGLINWIGFTLDSCIDQAKFMSERLNVSDMKGRIAAALTYEQQAEKSGVRIEALQPLHYLFTGARELARADFKTMTGLGDRVATGTVSALLREGFLATDSPYGPVRFAIPGKALRFYFPALWPEAEQDHAAADAAPAQ